ncbi:DUF3226 domain-containing protein [Crenothrix sp.]|uniref:DUF3226 domain-containing protein n=1 Tax=Crenothrix sp. TaxID=3100433 RepID=UPI00374D973D
MANQDRVLLVEGGADQDFFIEVLKQSNLQVMVKVAPPKVLGGSHNTKEGVFNFLPKLLDQLADGNLVKLAVVVDADSVPNGSYQTTLSRVTSIVSTYRYNLSPIQTAGITYKHDDGLADFGLWIMPDNTNEGMLEDWLKQCIHANEQTLFAHAQSVIDELPNPPKFKPLHRSKAEVATWLAWQKQPGHGLYQAVTDQLLDSNKPLYSQLTAWLAHIYA